MIRVSNFSKTYRNGFFSEHTVVQNLSFEVNKGTCVGFLGHNGSGKSTTMRAILGLIRPTAGSIEVFGLPPNDPSIKGRIGYLPEIYPCQLNLSIRKELRYLGKLSSMMGTALEERIDYVLEKLCLKSSEAMTGKSLSKGMVQRLGLSQLLLNSPEILILDEPTTGLDPQGRIIFADIIKEEKAKNNTIFFSSHILSDIEELCDDVIIIDKGRIIDSIPLSSLVNTSLKEHYLSLISRRSE